MVSPVLPSTIFSFGNEDVEHRVYTGERSEDIRIDMDTEPSGTQPTSVGGSSNYPRPPPPAPSSHEGRSNASVSEHGSAIPEMPPGCGRGTGKKGAGRGAKPGGKQRLSKAALANLAVAKEIFDGVAKDGGALGRVAYLQAKDTIAALIKDTLAAESAGNSIILKAQKTTKELGCPQTAKDLDGFKAQLSGAKTKLDGLTDFAAKLENDSDALLRARDAVMTACNEFRAVRKVVVEYHEGMVYELHKQKEEKRVKDSSVRYQKSKVDSFMSPNRELNFI